MLKKNPRILLDFDEKHESIIIQSAELIRSKETEWHFFGSENKNNSTEPSKI